MGALTAIARWMRIARALTLDLRQGITWLKTFRDPRSPFYRREREVWVEA